MPAADDVAPPIANRIPGLEDKDTETLVRINGGVQLVAGTLFALGRFRRLSALALAASLVPTTLAGHRFWEHEDEGPQGARAQEQMHFFKNVSMLGGLLIAAGDTEGKPGVAWRAQHAAERAGKNVRRTRREVKAAGKAARREARLGAKAAGSRAANKATKAGGKAAKSTFGRIAA